MCGNELGGTSTGLWLGASMSYDRSNFLINVRATQGAGALYEKSRANDTEFGVVAYLYIEALSRGLRVSERRGFSKCGLNRGIVCDPAAPFGGMRQQASAASGPRRLLEFLDTQYIYVNW